MEFLKRLENPGALQASRRTFLKAGLVTTIGMALPATSFARLITSTTSEKSLSLYNTHTGESRNNVVFWADGRYVPENLREINHLLRDHRTGDVQKIDPELFDLLHTVNQLLCASAPFHIISGYRSRATNSSLRQNSKGVAKRSFHTLGQAIDIRVPGCDIRNIREAALNLSRGGVGYYPESDFVHLDTGPVRSW